MLQDGAVRTLTIACVQAQSRDGQPEANLAGAEPLVARAAAAGAELLLCPEFLAAGYCYHARIWRAAEQRDGRTEAWLRGLAHQHGVFIGASYLEAQGEHFYNTFALAAPDGRVVGRVRKASLPAFEGWYFRGDPGPGVIACELGRVAVGICNDNATARFWNVLRHQAPDLLLMPHSSPVVSGPLGAVANPALCDNMEGIAPHYARGFGVPVALVNKAEAPPARSPLPLFPGVSVDLCFRGGSMICAGGTGEPLCRLGSKPDIAQATVTLDPALRRTPEAARGHWARPPGRFPGSSACSGAVWKAAPPSPTG